MTLRGQILTEEQKKKLSVSQMGHKVSEETRKKISETLSGNIPWNKGLKGYHPKGVGFKKGNFPWNKGLNVQTNTGRTHFQKGEKSPKWKGGISELTARIRASESYNKWRADVFRRDGWTCQTCGLRGHGRDIEAHHIKPFALYPKLRFNTENGITLCSKCHQESKGKEEWYENQLYQLREILQ